MNASADNVADMLMNVIITPRQTTKTLAQRRHAGSEVEAESTTPTA